MLSVNTGRRASGWLFICLLGLPCSSQGAIAPAQTFFRVNSAPMPACHLPPPKPARSSSAALQPYQSAIDALVDPYEVSSFERYRLMGSGQLNHLARGKPKLTAKEQVETLRALSAMRDALEAKASAQAGLEGMFSAFAGRPTTAEEKRINSAYLAYLRGECLDTWQKYSRYMELYINARR